MFFTGAFFLVCGILMLLNWIGGKTEVDGGGIFAFVLGDSLFALLAMAICLFIGVAGVIAPFMGENDQARAARERRERALERAAERRASGRARRPERRSASGSILLECPHCGASSRIPAKYAGKKGRCPRCDSGVRAPELE